MNEDANLFIQKYAVENVVCEMAAILYWIRCVKQKSWLLFLDYLTELLTWLAAL